MCGVLLELVSLLHFIPEVVWQVFPPGQAGGLEGPYRHVLLLTEPEGTRGVLRQHLLLPCVLLRRCCLPLRLLLPPLSLSNPLAPRSQGSGRSRSWSSVWRSDASGRRHLGI